MGPTNEGQLLNNNQEVNKTKIACRAWKNILDHRPSLKKDITWVIGNGQSIKLWYDHWMDDSPLIIKTLPNRSHIDEWTKVNDFITMSKQWNTNLLTEFLTKVH